MLCRKCRSPYLEGLPANQLIRNPGYVCLSCGSRMRPRGSIWIYLLVILIGVTFVGVGCWAIIDDRKNQQDGPSDLPWAKLMSVVSFGGIFAGWAGWQLRLPTPIQGKNSR